MQCEAETTRSTSQASDTPGLAAARAALQELEAALLARGFSHEAARAFIVETLQDARAGACMSVVEAVHRAHAFLVSTVQHQ